jgi:hypothetical protein
MDASIDHNSPLKEAGPGRFTRVWVQTPAGEIEARLSEKGNWELRVRRDEETGWRLACSGDLDCGMVVSRPVSQETLTRGALTVDPDSRRAMVGETTLKLSRKEFALLLVLATQLATVWGHNGLAQTRTLDAHTSKLRRKLRHAGADGMIVNSWGIGYRLWDRTDAVSFPPLTPIGRAA